MSPWRIVPLHQHPQLADTLARWHHAQWGALMAPWTFAEALAELQAHAAGGDCPTTLVALTSDDTLLGSVSLVLEDAPELKHFGPWLASLYVAPAARGHGIGAALVRALVRHAASVRGVSAFGPDGIDTLYLFTHEHARWYQTLGWEPIGRMQAGVQEVDVLAINVKKADYT